MYINSTILTIVRSDNNSFQTIAKFVVLFHAVMAYIFVILIYPDKRHSVASLNILWIFNTVAK